MAKNDGKSSKGNLTSVSGTVPKVAAARPATKAGLGGGTGTAGIDLDVVRELARIAGEFNLAEVEADPSGRVRVRREIAGPGIGAGEGRGHAGLSPLALAPSPPAAAAGPAETGTFVTSPFVGTFYRSPSPESPSFVEVGQVVRKGQVVCIVEAMKLMNEIEAETDGKILEVMAQNGAHVEYGQQLFRLAPA
jgi:acetyl-CoA carboxylase biotin carboxyl carrier protein